MKVRVTNNSAAPYGVEQVGGGYLFIPPGKTRLVDAAAPARLYQLDFLEVEAEDAEVPEIPARLAEKAKSSHHPLDHDRKGGPGGSLSGAELAKQEVQDLRAEYQRVLGKRPFSGWDAYTLRERIAAASK